MSGNYLGEGGNRGFALNGHAERVWMRPRISETCKGVRAFFEMSKASQLRQTFLRRVVRRGGLALTKDRAGRCSCAQRGFHKDTRRRSWFIIHGSARHVRQATA